MPNMPTNLKDFWNVYDALNVWRNFGAGTPPQASIGDAMWNQVRASACAGVLLYVAEVLCAGQAARTPCGTRCGRRLPLLAPACVWAALR